MKSVFSVLAFFVIGQAHAASDVSSLCQELKQILISTQSNLKMGSFDLKLADNIYRKAVSSERLEETILTAERAVALGRNQTCLSAEKLADNSLREKFDKLTKLNLELESSNNALIKRSISLDGEISYLLAIQK